MTDADFILSLARKAYTAYCDQTGWRSAVTGVSLPPFDQCPRTVKDGWIAVASKMILELVPDFQLKERKV